MVKSSPDFSLLLPLKGKQKKHNILAACQWLPDPVDVSHGTWMNWAVFSPGWCADLNLVHTGV